MLRHTLMFACLLALVFQVSAADQDAKKKAPPFLKGTAADFIKQFDKNNDGKLDKSEVPERMAQFFERIDINKDGKLDEKEVDEMLKRLRQNLGKGDGGPLVQRVLEKIDANKDGKISKDEAKGPLQQSFDRLDADKNGFLDKEELGKLGGILGNRANPNGRPTGDNPATPRNEGILFFDSLDKNADGRLTREELQGQPKILQAFAVIDTNKDGKLDPKEYEAFLKKQAEQPKPE